MGKWIIAIIAVAALGGGYYYMQSTARSSGATQGDAMQAITETPATETTGSTTPQAPAGTAQGESAAPAPTSSGEKTYTMADVSAHATAASCWSIINGNVYDLTSWIGKHPGGEKAITQLCGKDGSAEFNGQHGGAMRQANTLAGFKIGAFAK